MRRILWRNSYLSLLAVAACAAAASGTIYTWSGTGTGNDDTNPDNWCDSEPCGTSYPDGTDDDALFPVTPPGGNGVWGDVDLDFDGSLEIDDMTIKAGVDFNGHSGTPPVLTVSTLTIDATNDDIMVTFNGKLNLTANE